jgi:hypothetical protein
MTTPASKPGRWLSQTAYNLQADVEKAIVKVRSQVDRATAGHSPVDTFEREAGHFALGVAHGVLGMATGVIAGVGNAEQVLTDPVLDAALAQKAEAVLQHPGESAQALTDAIVRAFHQDAAYSAGDFATLLIPAAVGFAVGGPVGAAGGFVLGGVAAANSPQPPLAIDQPDIG